MVQLATQDFRAVTVPIADVVSPAPRSAWREVLAGDPGATALQTPEYFSAALAGTHGRDASRLYMLADGRRLVLPMIRQRTIPGVRLEADFPGGYGHGGMIATGGLRSSDVAAVVGESARQRVQHPDRRGPSHRRPVGVRPAGLEWSSPVAGSRSSTWTADSRRSWRTSSAARCGRASIAPRGSGVEVEVDTTGRLARTFYEIYLTWVEHWVKKSKLPDALARFQAKREERWQKFATVTGTMGEQCRIFVARHQGVPVASAITFVHGAHAIGWRSYSLRDTGLRLGANSFTQAMAIKNAAESGCRYFDLGQSGGVEDLLRYKRSLGAEPREVVDLRIESPRARRLRGLRLRAEASVVKLLSHQSMGYQTTIADK